MWCPERIRPSLHRREPGPAAAAPLAASRPDGSDASAAGAGAAAASAMGWENLGKKELTELLMAFGSPTDGSKAELLARLQSGSIAQHVQASVGAAGQQAASQWRMKPRGGAAAPVPEEALMMLMSMGFEQAKCEKALCSTAMNIERATEWIFSHMDDHGGDPDARVDEAFERVHSPGLDDRGLEAAAAAAAAPLAAARGYGNPHRDRGRDQDRDRGGRDRDRGRGRDRGRDRDRDRRPLGQQAPLPAGQQVSPRERPALAAAAAAAPAGEPRCVTRRDAEAFVASLGLHSSYLNRTQDRCYCIECYPATWPDVMTNKGPTAYVIPRGWVRVGLADPRLLDPELKVFEEWSVSFHGVKSKQVLRSILQERRLMTPGDTLMDGSPLVATKSNGRQNDGVFYTSPTVQYAGLKFYAEPQPFRVGMSASIVLQCHQNPSTITKQGETMAFEKGREKKAPWPGHLKRECPHVDLGTIEWKSKAGGGTIPYGLLIRTYRNEDEGYSCPLDKGATESPYERAEKRRRVDDTITLVFEGMGALPSISFEVDHNVPLKQAMDSYSKRQCSHGTTCTASNFHFKIGQKTVRESDSPAGLHLREGHVIQVRSAWLTLKVQTRFEAERHDLDGGYYPRGATCTFRAKWSTELKGMMRDWAHRNPHLQFSGVEPWRSAQFTHNNAKVSFQSSWI